MSMLAAEGTAYFPQLDEHYSIVSTHQLLHDERNLLSDAGVCLISQDASSRASTGFGVFDSILLTLSDMHRFHQAGPHAGT